MKQLFFYSLAFKRSHNTLANKFVVLVLQCNCSQTRALKIFSKLEVQRMNFEAYKKLYIKCQTRLS